MAGPLDDMLEPGERVVWRAPQGSLLRENWFRWGVVLLITQAIAIVSAAHSGMGWVAILGLVPYLAAVTRRAPAAVAVTNRRALRLDTRSGAFFTRVTLRDVAAVAYRDDGLDVTTKAGEVVVFEDPAKAAEFAAALASATGLPEPPAAGRPRRRLWTLRDSLALAVLSGSVWAPLLGLAVLFPDWKALFDSQHLATFLFILLWTVGMVLWMVTSGPVIFALLSRFLPREELRKLARRPFAGSLYAEQPNKTEAPVARLLLPFVDRLYGVRAVQVEPKDSAHG